MLQVFVEACEPPLFFGERQGVDLKAWSGEATDAAFRSVLATVRVLPSRLLKPASLGAWGTVPTPITSSGPRRPGSATAPKPQRSRLALASMSDQ